MRQYHAWQADRALAAVLAQDHRPPVGTLVRDGAATPPVLHARPGDLIDWERESAAANGGGAPSPVVTPNAWSFRKTSTVAAGEAVVLAGSVPNDDDSDSPQPAAYLATAVAGSDHLAFGLEDPRTIRAGHSFVPLRGPMNFDFDGLGDRRLRFKLGQTGEGRPRAFSIPYELDGEAGEIRGALATVDGWRALLGSWGGQPGPSPVRAGATHGWLEVPAIRGQYDRQGIWHLNGGAALRGMDVRWGRVSSMPGGAVAFAPDGRVLVWAKLDVLQVDPPADAPVASVPEPDIYNNRKQAVADDPAAWNFGNTRMSGDSPLVKYHDIAPDGTFVFLRLDGYAFRVSPDGTVARFDLLPDVTVQTRCEDHPYYFAEPSEAAGHREIHLQWRYTRPHENPNGSGLALAGDDLILFDPTPRRLGRLTIDGKSIAWQNLGGPPAVARALAGGPDGAAVLIAGVEQKRAYQEVTADDGEVVRVHDFRGVEALDAPLVLYRKDAAPRAVGPGRPAGGGELLAGRHPVGGGRQGGRRLRAEPH